MSDPVDDLPPLPRHRRRVVIVGSGFAGIEAARALAHAPVDITIVDRRNFHLFQPLLYQVATAALSPSLIGWPIRSVFARQKNVEVLMYEVTSIDLARRTITNGERELPFDYLILATGARHAYFGHDDWEPFAPGLKTIADARALRERLLTAFEKAELTDDLGVRRRNLTVAIVGGGATGVEVAGAVVELAHRTLAGEFHRFDPKTTRIILVEAAPRLLGAFPEDLAQKALQSLVHMGVEVRTGTAVTQCDATGITLGDQHIQAATIIWAAGVQASPAGAWLGTECDRAGRVIVEPDLSVPGHPEVFVIGDTASVMRPDGKPVPGLAAAAKQMGKDVGRRVGSRAAGMQEPGPFSYKHQGDLATIGRNSAVVALGRVKLTGFAGWLFWCLIHVFFLIGFRSRVIVSINWVWSYFTLTRGARLISDDEAPPAPTS